MCLHPQFTPPLCKATRSARRELEVCAAAWLGELHAVHSAQTAEKIRGKLFIFIEGFSFSFIRRCSACALPDANKLNYRNYFESNIAQYRLKFYKIGNISRNTCTQSGIMAARIAQAVQAPGQIGLCAIRNSGARSI